jgi:hypothetical protein
MKIELRIERIVDKWAQENKVLVNENGTFYAYIRNNKQIRDRLKEALKKEVQGK